MTSGNAIVAGPSSRPIPSRYCNLPDPARLARLSLSSSIDKHVASLQGLPDDYSPSAAAISPQIASALAVSFVRHLLFARGLTSTTIGQLEKERQREQQLDTGAVRGPKTQRRKRRDQLLDSLKEAEQSVHRSILAARPHSSTASFPLLLVIGNSPLSAREVHYIDLETSIPETPHPDEALQTPLPTKLRATLERRLVRFLISTDELQEVLMSPEASGSGGKTKVWLFTPQRANWRCPGWRSRRGVKLNTNGIVVLKGVEDAETMDCDVKPSELSSLHSQATTRSSTSSPVPVEVIDQELNQLSEALSPSRRVTIDQDDPVTLLCSPLQQLSCNPIDDASSAVSSSEGDKDQQPRRSRIYPANLAPNSLLARNRLRSLSRAATPPSSTPSSTASSPFRRAIEGSTRPIDRPIRGKRDPKGAGFVLDCKCSIVDTSEGMKTAMELSPAGEQLVRSVEPSHMRTEEGKDRQGEAELCLFQCEVPIPSFH